MEVGHFNGLGPFGDIKVSDSKMSTTNGDGEDSHRLTLCVQEGDLKTWDLYAIFTARDLTRVTVCTRTRTGVSDLRCGKFRSCASL